MIDYKEIKLTDIIEYYVKGFKFPKGEELIYHEYFVDRTKNAVVFKFYLEKKDN